MKCSFKSSTSLGLNTLLSLLSLALNVQSESSKNYGHSNLILYKRNQRYEIDSKTCTVGVAFDKPEIFTCACVNGIWAFYGDTTCGQPLAMIGGNNYCFQLPNIPIQEITTISSPMRALSSSLTILERQMDSVKTKIYRNVHMSVDERSGFVALNSSWTLLSPNGAEGVCLNSKSLEDQEEDGKEGLEGFFCTFTNIKKAVGLGKIGGIEKGCYNTSFPVLEPLDCQPLLSANSESICKSIPIDEDGEVVGDDLDLLRYARGSSAGFANAKKASVKDGVGSINKPKGETEAASGVGEGIAKISYPEGYDKAPAWRQREIRDGMASGKGLDQGGGPMGRSMDSGSADSSPNPNGMKSQSEILEMMNKEWKDSTNFHNPAVRNFEQDHVLTYQLLRYMEIIIKHKLSHSTGLLDVLTSDGSPVPRAVSLLIIAKDIIVKLCPLQSPEYFHMIFKVFLEIQTKYYRWMEPFVRPVDFKRIEAALSSCREEAQPLVFKNDCKGNINGEPPPPAKRTDGSEGQYNDTLVSNDLSGSSGSLPTLSLPESLKSTGKEPIIESVWKGFVTTHSYCYKHFNQFYNDHHKFTTIMFPLFNNEIQKNWFRNITTEEEYFYSSVIGSVKSIWENLDKCTIAARAVSTYPFHLTRPSLEVKYDLNWKIDQLNMIPGGARVRRKRANDDNYEEEPEVEMDKPLSFAEDIIEPETELDPWKRERKMMDGMGFCLKKYNEAKLHLGIGC